MDLKSWCETNGFEQTDVMMIVTLYNHQLIDALRPDANGLPLLRDLCRNEIVYEKAKAEDEDFHLVSLRHIQSDLALSDHGLKQYLMYWAKEMPKMRSTTVCIASGGAGFLGITDRRVCVFDTTTGDRAVSGLRSDKVSRK